MRNNKTEQHHLIRQAKLLEYANAKRIDGDFNDVTIQAGTENIPANRMVLACYSKFFEAMFYSPFRERSQDIVEIKGFDGEAIKAVIEYIYSGKIEINVSNLGALLGVADFLQVDDVKKMCFNLLKTLLTINSCLDVVKVSEAYNNSSLCQQTYQLYINHYFDAIVQGYSFRDLAKNELISLLKNIDRNTAQESSLYKAIVKWVKYDETREIEFSSLFLSLDLQKLEPDFVLETIVQEPLVKSSKECLNATLSYFVIRTKHAQQQKCKASKVLCLGEISRRTDVTPFEVCNVLDKLKQKNYPNLPKSISRNCVLKLDDFVYCLGGVVGKDAGKRNSTNKVHRMNLKTVTSQWNQVASMNVERCDFGAAVWNGKLVATGGFKDFLRTNSTEMYEAHLNIWRTIASMNEERDEHALVVADNKLFAIGGSDVWYDNLSSVEQLDNVDGKWKFIKSMNAERSYLSAVEFSNFIYAIGGSSNGKTLKSVEKYDLNEDKWSFVTSMNYERKGHASCVLEGKILVIGGKDENNKVVKTIESYDPTTDQWTNAGVTNQDFYNHAIVLL